MITDSNRMRFIEQINLTTRDEVDEALAAEVLGGYVPLREKLALDFVDWTAKSGALGEPLTSQLQTAAKLWAAEKEAHGGTR